MPACTCGLLHSSLLNASHVALKPFLSPQLGWLGTFSTLCICLHICLSCNTQLAFLNYSFRCILLFLSTDSKTCCWEQCNIFPPHFIFYLHLYFMLPYILYLPDSQKRYLLLKSADTVIRHSNSVLIMLPKTSWQAWIGLLYKIFQNQVLRIYLLWWIHFLNKLEYKFQIWTIWFPRTLIKTKVKMTSHERSN